MVIIDALVAPVSHIQCEWNHKNIENWCTLIYLDNWDLYTLFQNDQWWELEMNL